MSSAIPMKQEFDVSRLVVDGDVSRLTPEQKSQYYILRCKEHGMSPSSQPFNYLRLNGKEVLYANKGCAEQLRAINKVSIKITKADQVGDLFVVIAEAKDGNGREDSATGAVTIVGLKGESLANAMMKAETKAKRRVTLSICGLNMLDETEVESMKSELPSVRPENPPAGEFEESSEWRFTFGKWKNRTIEQVYHDEGPEKLASYIIWLENTAKRTGQGLSDAAQDVVKQIENFLGAMENGTLEPGVNS
jgi:uncharacterized metal-binding protein